MACIRSRAVYIYIVHSQLKRDKKSEQLTGCTTCLFLVTLQSDVSEVRI